MTSETRNTKLCRIVLAIIMLALLLAGCSSTKQAEIDTPEAALELLVQELDVNESESHIYPLREAMLDHELIYVFEIVAKKKVLLPRLLSTAKLGRCIPLPSSYFLITWRTAARINT